MTAATFLPKIVVSGVCAWAHSLFFSQPTNQQLNVDIMKGISEAILEDVRSPVTRPRLQYTMGQCFKKVLKAVKVYASPYKEEIRDFFAGLINREHLECLSMIRNAAENLEEAANAKEFVDRNIAEVLHTPQWGAVMERSVPGTGGQAHPGTSTGTGPTVIEIDSFMELCARKAVLPDECEKCLGIADQYAQNEDRLAVAQRWWATASEVQKKTPEGDCCWGDIQACLQYRTTYKQEGYAAYQELWISRIELFQ